jgi:hypothetical protein
MMSLAVAKRVQLASQPFKVTITWHPPTRPGFISAWDAARNAYGHEAFDALNRDQQCKAVQQYVNR